MARIEVARREVEHDPLELEYGGQVYDLPPTLPLDALEAMEENRIVGFLKAVLGKQWGKFSKEFNTDDLDALADAMAEAYGRSLGESGASGASS